MALDIEWLISRCQKGDNPLRALLANTVLAAALPALAAPTCPAPQVAQGFNCTLTTTFGWATAGLGTQSILTLYVPPTSSTPISFQLTALSSSLGTSYTGYFGTVSGQPGQAGTQRTLSEFSGIKLDPGQLFQSVITQVCWDPTCTSAAPAGAIASMFSGQITATSPNPADLTLTPSPLLTIQFLNGSQVTFEETESTQMSGPNNSYIPGINIGAAPAGRYVYSGAAVEQPFDALSVTNPSTAPISGTVTIEDSNANAIATAPIPAIPPGGAAGYLVIGRTPGDSLGLFPSSTVLPAASDGIFHGTLLVTMDGPNITLAQEYNGNAMLNLLVLH
jgi:hypothetical protein